MSYNKYFLFPFVIFLITGTAWLLLSEKWAFILWLNARHTPLLDYIFYYFTILGNGIVVICITLALLLVRIRYTLIGLAIFLTSGLLSQILKHAVNTPRPKALLFDLYDLHTVEGVHLLSSNSFPSGHTCSAFALFTFLSLIITNKKWGLLFFGFALMVAISRVYLLQHFFVDVYCGAFIGVITAFWLYFLGTTRSKTDKYKWLDLSIQKLKY